MMPLETTAAAVMVLEWAMTVGASVRLAADKGARLGVSRQAPVHVADALRRIEVRVQIATWMDGAAARWPSIWDEAGLLARTWIAWRGSRRVQFSAQEISQHCVLAQERNAVMTESAELADFLAVGDVVRLRDACGFDPMVVGPTP